MCLVYIYLQRFICNDFSPTHHLSINKKEYYPSLILNESLFELKIIDLPVVPYFPPDNIAEWTDFKYYGLRSASAYILVYDVSVPSTFQFIKTLREQMFETRDMTNIPVLVVANKMDLEVSKTRIPLTMNNNNPPSHHFSTIVSHHSIQHKEHKEHKEREHQHSQHHQHHHSQHHQQHHPHYRIHSHHHSHHGHGAKTEQYRESGGPGGVITGATSSAGAGSAPTAVTGSTTDSFYHHSKPFSSPHVNNTIGSTTTSKSNPVAVQNGITTVSKSTKGISRWPQVNTYFYISI